jgi:hypothetical protein
MALGDRTDINSDAYALDLLLSAIAANGAPVGAVGIEANLLRGFGLMPKKIRVAVISTSGSGVMTVTAKLWVRLGALGWVMAQQLNAGAAIAETSADGIGYSEPVDTIDGADRYYLEIVAIAGTTPAIKAELVVSRPQA